MHKIIIVISTIFFSVNVFSASCSKRNNHLCKSYNDDLNSFMDGRQTRNATNSISIPRRISQAWDLMQTFGIPKYEKVLDQIQVSNKYELYHGIIQEYLRGRKDGMPWLPQSWAIRVIYQYHVWDEGVEAIEKTLANKFSYPLSDSDLALAYLFVGNTPHVNSFEYLKVYRELAKDIVKYDSRFQDIRDDVHQQPSLRTITRLKEYIKMIEQQGHRHEAIILNKARKIIDYIMVTYGGGSLDKFLDLYSPSSNIKNALKARIRLLDELSKKGSQKIDSKLQYEIVSNLSDLADQSLTVSNRVRNNRTGSCRFDKKVNCLFENIDLLKHMQLGIFTSANELLSKISQTQSEVKMKTAFEFLRALSKAGQATGMLSDRTLKQVDKALNKKFLSSDYILRTMKKIENEVIKAQLSLQASFSSAMAPYKNFVPDVHLLIDNILRSTPILPLTNTLSRLFASLEKSRSIKIGNDSVVTRFRVLNSGTAIGTLYIAKENEISSIDYEYDPNGIYYLPKTPASLHKVAGVLTADSGSVLSHVQLLAANHGLPNVKVSDTLESELRAFEGKEVLMLALPNGEVHIKLLKDASQKEIKAHNKYHRIGTKKKIKLEIPTEVFEYNYILRLDQLRMSDSGIIAGGKACGQGELSHVFKNRVPHGFVLPFGVYYDHMKKAGVLDFIKEMLSGSVNHKVLSKRLEKIRKKIMGVDLDSELEAQIRERLSRFPYVNPETGAPRGVFVRSDTNAEDREEFVGAGLNKTVPNVIGADEVLKAIKTVWASAFRTKSYTWRDDLIENPWDILPSVIIQLGFPSEKAGVMVVGDTKTEDKQDSLYIAANRGLGLIVVDGMYSAEEVLYSRKNQTYSVVANSSAPIKYVFGDSGGVESRPVQSAGNILTEDNIKQLAHLGESIQLHISNKYGKLAKWDMEWGIAKGPSGDEYPVLFQIRPFVGNKIVKDFAVLSLLESKEFNNSANVSYDMSSSVLILTEE